MEKNMYKKLFAAFLVVFTSVANADFVRVEAGAGIWVQDPSQTLKNNTTNHDTEGEVYVWALVKHFVPMIPNLRVEHVSSTSGVLEFSQIDFIPYYNILDNTAWITLDLGFDIKKIDLTMNNSIGTLDPSSADSFVLPLAYVRTRAQLPLSGLAAEADLKYISYGDNTVYDARIKLDYTFEITPLIQPGIEIGYRVQKIETDELLPVLLDVEFSGIYAGAMIRF
jgi:outer membrane protein